MTETNANAYVGLARRFDEGNTFIRRADGVDTHSYQDLEHISAAYANRFRTMGLSRGDRVIVQVEKSAECLFIYFACLRSGLIYLPLNTAYQAHEVEYFCADATPALVICDPLQVDTFRRFTDCTILTLDAQGAGTATTPARGETFRNVASQPDDTAVILYTSGTTGRPKGAMITHRNLVANAEALHTAWGWVPGDVMLHALPIFHIHGLFVATHLAVLNASPVILLDKFDPATVIRLFREATVYMGVPTNYVRLLANPALDREACSNMRLFTSGSAPLLVPTFQEFEARTGHTIVERYGMTETGMNTSNPLEGKRKPGTVGPPLPGVSLKIVDDVGDRVTPGDTGNLLVRGDNVFSGYWQMPEKTAAEFDPDGYFRTGDLASEDEDGYISIVGRSKDLVISGGLNVYPKEIESLIDDIPGVVESAVIGLPHPDFGEAVTAVVVREPGSQLVESDVITFLRERIANFKVAKHVFFVDELPRNTMGKVQKNVLRESLRDAVDPA